MECLICSEPIKHAHLGVNSCRACAVFYKRTADAKKKLKCKGGKDECLKLSAKSTCRLCRFTRFNEILERAVGTEEMPREEVAKVDLETASGSSSFINHESFYEREPADSCTRLLDRLRKGYSLMCVIRLAGELAIRTKEDEESAIHVSNMMLVRATYSTVLQHFMICKQALKAFANHAFDDFRELDEESKEFIIEKAKGAMNSLDISYRSTHHFPKDDDTRSLGYTTYVRLPELERFFANCPDNIDAEKIISEVKKRFETSGKRIRRAFKLAKPTDQEFLALLGLAFWNDEITNLNEKMLLIAMKNRAMIMRDLHAYYAQQGKLDYASRIGHFHCMLLNFQNHATMMFEDFQLYRLMNLFKEHFDRNAQ